MLNKLKFQVIINLIDLIFYLIKKIGTLRKKINKGVNTMADIKETKDAMLFGISLAMAIDQSTQDGFQWTDMLNLVPPMAKLPAAIAGMEKIPAEIDDLDDAERAELVKSISELDFASDQSEIIAEQALRTGVEICNLIMKIRELRVNK